MVGEDYTAESTGTRNLADDEESRFPGPIEGLENTRVRSRRTCAMAVARTPHIAVAVFRTAVGAVRGRPCTQVSSEVIVSEFTADVSESMSENALFAEVPSTSINS